MASDQHESGEQQAGLEEEADALVELFNEAAESYSPDLNWFAMASGAEPPNRRFVFEAKSYIDPAGLEALKDAGRRVTYIEAFAPDADDGDAFVSIHVPVEGSAPETEVQASA